MRKIKIKKQWLVTIGIYIFAIAAASVVVFFQYKHDQKYVAFAGIVSGSSPARLNDNVRGFAWSSNIGWISFNSADCDVDGNGVFSGTPAGCPPNGTPFYDYGVNINSSGNFLRSDGSHAYAWSNNVGWIDFSPTSGYPAGGPAYAATKNLTTGLVTGWAQIVALGADGWIKMSDNANASWNGKGVTISGAGDFSGWAWNGNNTAGTGIGWISFNCSNESSCGTASYMVSTGMAPNAPAIGAVEEQSGTCKTVKVNWTDNSNNESGFNVEKSTNGTIWTDFCTVPLTAPDVTSCTNIISPSTSYYFRVRAVGSSSSGWSTSPLTAIGFCAPALTEPLSANYNCDRINLSWTQQGTGVNHYEVWRDKDAAGFILLVDDITPVTLNYSDTDIESGSKYEYKIKAQNAGLDSNTVGPINPCPNLPSWRETKAQ